MKKIDNLIKAMKQLIKNSDDVEQFHISMDNLLLTYINDKRVTALYNSQRLYYA